MMLNFFLCALCHVYLMKFWFKYFVYILFPVFSLLVSLERSLYSLDIQIFSVYSLFIILLKVFFIQQRFLTCIKANLSFLKTLKKIFLQQRTLWLNPTHKHGTILHLFILNLISSINVLLFLAYRFCTWFAKFKQTKLQN